MSGTNGINEATLRRLQERMERELGITAQGRKTPEENNNLDDPAKNNNKDDCHHTAIYTAAHTEPTQPSSTLGSEYDRHVRQQAQILREFERRTCEVGAHTGVVDVASPVSSLGEEFWTCGGCGLDCPLMHRFCGNCGTGRPENWWCECGCENSPYARFCVSCGAREDDFDDDEFDPDDQEVMEHNARRFPLDRGIPNSIPPAGAQDWDDIDDELTFANDSCDADLAALAAQRKQQAPQPPERPPAQSKKDDSDVWTCGVCTYLNENPLFMCCEVCGSARPASPGADIEAIAKKVAMSDDSSADSSKKREKSIQNMIREQQKHCYRQHGQGSVQHSLPESETDHELAMIYAQQERIMAQFQQQQARR